MIRYVTRSLLTVGFLMPLESFAQNLTMENFLNAVKQGNKSYRASEASEDGAVQKSLDAEMIFAPNFFVTVQSTTDKKELVPSAQRGKETNFDSTQIGFSKLYSSGTAAKIYFNGSQTRIKGASSQFVPESSWKETAPTIEISQPLWKNFFGSDVKKTVAIQNSQARITGFIESIKRKSIIAEAESTYWRLVLARESVSTNQENLSRARKIQDWTRKRVASDLADKADLMQADALVDIREIELTLSMDEERSARLSFNSLRGSPDSEVIETLEKITPELISRIKAPERSGDREDLKAALESAQIVANSADLSESKYQPSLDLFASGAMNGREPSFSESSRESIRGKHTALTMGLRFSTPLGGATTRGLRAAYANDIAAANLTSERKRFELDQEWRDLTIKLTESKSRLSLAQKLETTQKQKLEAEKNRQSKGRSTMFQVMQSESDYASAQLGVLRNKAEILGLMARMRTFGGEK